MAVFDFSSLGKRKIADQPNTDTNLVHQISSGGQFVSHVQDGAYFAPENQTAPKVEPEVVVDPTVAVEPVVEQAPEVAAEPAEATEAATEGEAQADAQADSDKHE